MASPVYSIRDWSQHFENNRTRELKELRFVILPNRHDGDGYTELLNHPDGAAHYGAWVALIQVASRGQHPAGGCGNPAGCCECRGILLRDGARPHDAASLARITRIPESVFAEALERLANIGWIEVAGGSAQSRRGVRKDAVLTRARANTEQNGMEGNGIEQKGIEQRGADAPFDSPAFLEALADYEQHRKEIGKTLRPQGRKALYKDLAAFGERGAIQSLRQSIAKGWTGVFAPRGNGKVEGLDAVHQVLAELEAQGEH